MNKEIVTELNKILPVVERVHSDHHPELHKVAMLYQKLLKNPDADIFFKLRDVTDGYKVPEDACPTYRKVYEDLAMLDQERFTLNADK